MCLTQQQQQKKAHKDTRRDTKSHIHVFIRRDILSIKNKPSTLCNIAKKGNSYGTVVKISSN